MATSHFSRRSIITVIAFALASCFTACWRIVADAAWQVERVYRRTRDWGVRLIDRFTAWHEANFVRPGLTVPRKDHRLLLRQARRERPVAMTQAQWRMCPST